MSLLGKVGAASAADKDRWCAEAPARFDGETMSPMRKPSLVRALQSYKPLDR